MLGDLIEFLVELTLVAFVLLGLILIVGLIVAICFLIFSAWKVCCA